MSIVEQVEARLREWAKEAFAGEIKTGFARAKIFDAPLNRLVFDTLSQFSTAEHYLLGEILPTRRVDGLSPAEQGVADRFKAGLRSSYETHHSEIIAAATSVCRQPVREEVKKIRAAAGKVFKEIARHWDFEIRKEEPRIWALSDLYRWAEIDVYFDLQERGEFSYEIYMRDGDYRQIVTRDAFMGRLGLPASSACRMVDSVSCEEKIWKVAELARWQVNDYIQIIKSLTTQSNGVANANREE